VIKPRVIYAMGSRFGTSDSLGTVSGHAVRALLQSGYLHQLLVGSYRPGSAPTTYTRQLGLLSRVLRKLAMYDPAGYVHWLSDELFDLWSRQQFRTGNLLHAWGQGALRTLRCAQAKGAKTIVERASSHILTQQTLLAEEYARFRISFRPILSAAIDKALREFEVADYTLVPSEFAYNSFVEHGFDRRKLILNPFGVDTARFQPGPGDAGQFRAVFAGQISLRKGVPYLLEAWARLNLPRAELMMIGSIAPDSRAVIAPYTAHPTIRWIGFTPNLVDYLGRASVFVFPSIEEGSALVTYMALACGLPVITTPNAGSVVRHSQEGLLVPIRDVTALGEALQQLYDDAHLRAQMAVSARRRAEEFTWSHYQARLLDAYMTTVNPCG